MAETTATKEAGAGGFSVRTAALLVVPLILLGLVIALFATTGAGLDLAPPAPVEDLTVQRIVVTGDTIELHVHNSGPEPLTVAQIIINDAFWPFSVEPSRTLPRLGTGLIRLPYHVVEGEAYGISILTENAVEFEAEIPVAFESPTPTGKTLLSFTLIGVYVGIIPVYLGILWFPALRQVGRRWLVFLFAVTAGLLVYLGIDSAAEALEVAELVPGPLQGVGLVGLGIVVTFLLLDAISRRQSQVGRSEAERRLTLATLIATGIGIHNLGEGLAIGAAYTVGEIALGSFLVIGFIIQNITEGIGIIAPILRDRPGIARLALLGLLGGAPAVLGAWIGGFTPSFELSALFLAIGAGAIFQVTYEIAKLIGRQTKGRPIPFTVFAGVTAGTLVLYFTGILVK